MKKIFALVMAVMMLSCAAWAGAETIFYATNPEYPPFESVEADGTVVGYDIDLINAIGEKTGIAFQPKAMAFAAVVADVMTNKDVIGLSGISITEERLLSVNFSDGYIDAGLVVIMKADAGFASMDDLKEKKIGVQLGTTSDFKAEEITGADNVQTYNTFIDAVLDLQIGQIDAVIVDGPVGQAILSSLNDPSLVIADIDLGAADWYGIAVNKANTELLDKINGALAELKAEGFLDELAAKYFSDTEAAE